MSLRTQMRYMNPYEVHKLLINAYVLNRAGDTSVLKRDTSKDKTDYDVLRTNHKFIWNEEPDSWETQFAKKYYDKLFKEYCIGDLTLYKENKVALRWRVEHEVISGKGQFICANKKCSEKEDLKTWEVNFAYKEDGESKNALVKIRLCPSCSDKLNYHSKKRQIKRKDRRKKGKETTAIAREQNDGECSTSRKRRGRADEDDEERDSTTDHKKLKTANEEGTEETVDESPWQKQDTVEIKTREDEMEDYLNDLLL